jgi:hypothetical protein
MELGLELGLELMGEGLGHESCVAFKTKEHTEMVRNSVGARRQDCIIQIKISPVRIGLTLLMPPLFNWRR